LNLAAAVDAKGTPVTPEPKFLRRFEQIRTSLRRYQGRLGMAATILAAATGLGLLAWSDFYHELSRPSRAVGLAIATLATLAVLWRWFIAPLRWWTKPRTAFEIEARFPQLGQRIRTVVQYGGRPDQQIEEEGVKPSLVQALEGETEEQSSLLPLDQVVRWRRAHALGSLAALPVALLAFAAITSSEWQTAIKRAILIETPYTTVEVKPGNVLVDQGENVAVAVELKGRPRKTVVLQTRISGKPESSWKSEKIESLAKGATVEKVKDPVHYRVVAGPAESPAYVIRVRYPLAIKTFEVQVTPPTYTGLEPKSTKGGDVQAVEGSAATFKIVFDAMPSEAALELVDLTAKPPKKGEPAPGPTILPLEREGNELIANLDLSRDLEYKVVAKTADGRILPKNKYRIDVREDRAPRVVFDEPDEALEVHPIAEVRHRARVNDDFGLSRAGIVFRFNDGDEKTLIFKDFPVTKGQKPKTSATLEEMLLLETLNATPLDSVTYYAFAEDNFPGNPRRTETDLRYIDLRVFKREYKLAEPGSGDGDPQELIALDELIARQRVNLNRANRFVKHKPTDRTEADDPLKIAGFEETLLNLTKDFTEGVERLADARVDSLHKALDAMQASIDSLDRGRNTEVPPAMAEALKHLVAARRDLQFLIGNGNPALAAAMRAFDRKQAQKIRKPKNKDEEAEEIAERLEELAQEEDFVYATIATSMDGTGTAEAKGEMKGKPDKPKEPTKEAEAKDQEKESPKGEGEEGEIGKGKEGPKGVSEKGEAGNGKEGPKGKGGKGEAGNGKEREKGEAGKGEDAPKGEGEKGKEGPKGKGGKGETKGDGQGDDGEGGSGEPKKLDRKGVADKQQEIADEVRDLEEKLKRLEVASDLAKARMAKAAEKVEKVNGALTRGNVKEAAEDARAGAGMLHELARQVKGEIAKEAVDELAMARDLAEELARREAELADRNQDQSASGSPSDQKSKDGKDGKDVKGKDGKDGKGKDGKEGQGQGEGTKAGQGKGGVGAWDALTEAEQLDRMAEMARTLEAWLKQIDKQGEGKAADAVGEILDKGNVNEIVELAERMGELRVGGKKEELGREARELATKLEVLGQALELLHRGIVAPELAALVEFDRRMTELMEKLATLKSEAEVVNWKREMAALLRDLEKANVEGAAELADALRVGGGWHWDDAHRHLIAPDTIAASFRGVSFQIKERVQELILKDLASARDEATPPIFRELVERYYEVISKGVRAK
jgi:hypothetical protein